MTKYYESSLEPDEFVCGASKDNIKNWEWINSRYQPLTTKKNSEEVATKYIDDSSLLKSRVSKEIYNLCTQKVSECTKCPLKFTCKSYVPQIINKKSLTFADFFCGAGGLSIGFERAGLVPKVANDIDPWFVETYAFNRPKEDIEYFTGSIDDWIEKHKNDKKWDIDVVSGGVPCQSFSMANRQPTENDPRDHLYLSLIKAADIIKPKVLVIENVGGILKKFDVIISDLKKHNFDAVHILLNASDYGVPQNRKRVFFIALNNKLVKDTKNKLANINTHLAKYKSSTITSLKEAIKDLPSLQAHDKRNDTGFNNEKSGYSFTKHNLNKASEYVKKINRCTSGSFPLFNHKARFNNERDISIFSLLKEGENSTSERIQHLNPYKSRNDIFKDKYHKLKNGEVCKTITAHMRYDCNMYIHPTQPRGLTAREAARVQGFPDDYVFLGNFQRTYQQVGNAVPPLLAEYISLAIKKVLCH